MSSEIKKHLHKILIADSKYNIGLCYGLAPRPNGFTFDGDSVTKHVKRMLNTSLSHVESDSDATRELRQYIRGV